MPLSEMKRPRQSVRQKVTETSDHCNTQTTVQASSFINNSLKKKKKWMSVQNTGCNSRTIAAAKQHGMNGLLSAQHAITVVQSMANNS
jgi:hypothetical protein